MSLWRNVGLKSARTSFQAPSLASRLTKLRGAIRNQCPKQSEHSDYSLLCQFEIYRGILPSPSQPTMDICPFYASTLFLIWSFLRHYLRVSRPMTLMMKSSAVVNTGFMSIKIVLPQTVVSPQHCQIQLYSHLNTQFT